MSSNNQDDVEQPPEGYASPYKVNPTFNFEREDLPTQVAQLNKGHATIFSKVNNYGGGYEELNKYILNWPTKTATATPAPVSSGYCDITGRYFSGVNLATQDYMSMCGDEKSVAYLKKVLETGTFVGGVGGSRVPTKSALTTSGTTLGNSTVFPKDGQASNSVQIGTQTELDHLEATVEWYFDEVFWTGAKPGQNTRSIDEIKKLRGQGVTASGAKCYGKIFSTGWLAGYGCIQGLVGPEDWIVMDFLGHNCLKEGAKASQARLRLFEHLNVDDFEEKLKEIRQHDQQNAILAVTESLFSMDSDCGDLGRMQQLCIKYNATLLVDSAHDMFCTGQRGRGYVSDKVSDFSNVIVIGSGSKSLSSNFGYVVSGDSNLIKLLEHRCRSWTHSDVMPAPTALLVAHNIGVMASERGFKKRDQIRRNSKYLTKRLNEEGYETIGFASPIVIVYIGSEFLSRAIANFLYYDGIIVNSVEFPAVNQGESRLRIQLQSGHTLDQLEHFVKMLNEVIPKCQYFLDTDKATQVFTQKMIESMLAATKQQEAKL